VLGGLGFSVGLRVLGLAQSWGRSPGFVDLRIGLEQGELGSEACRLGMRVLLKLLGLINPSS
jgi:hypothetical protein